MQGITQIACAKALRKEKEWCFLGIGGRNESKTEAKKKPWIVKRSRRSQVMNDIAGYFPTTLEASSQIYTNRFSPN